MALRASANCDADAVGVLGENGLGGDQQFSQRRRMARERRKIRLS
jgi:hypothetical protein